MSHSPDGWATSGSPGTGDLRDAHGVKTDQPRNGQVSSEVSTQTVFGPDGRQRAINSAKYPERAHVLILAVSPDGNTYPCTGFLYSPDTVGTAGHCVHNKGRGGWIVSAQVFPGRDAGSTPYGYCEATRSMSVRGWVDDADRNYDYAALKLNCSIGNTTGWLGLYGKSDSFNGERVAIVGYPFEKDPLFSMWGMFGTIEGSRTYHLVYTIDTSDGQSGAPVYRPCSDGVGFCAIAVHTSGDSVYNYGNRFTLSMFNNFQDWRN